MKLRFEKFEKGSKKMRETKKIVLFGIIVVTSPLWVIPWLLSHTSEILEEM